MLHGASKGVRQPPNPIGVELAATTRAGAFTGRVAALFGTQVFGMGLTLVNGILLARMLGPAAKGDYYLIILVPSTATALILLGLPQAIGFFAARGQTVGLVGKAFWLTIVLSIVALIGTLLLLPRLIDSVERGVPIEQILFAFIAVPLGLSATFNTGIVLGRQAVRWKAAVNIAMPLATTFLIVLILGGLGSSVTGAIAVYLIAMAVGTIGFAIGAKRATTDVPGGRPTSYLALLRYGLPLYPASLAVFLNYRVDVYLIAWLIADSSEALGYYSMAVAIAELVFFFPDAVSTMFFPHVAGSPRHEADSQVAMVTRVTLLVSAAVAVAVIPAAYVLISIFLPAFGPSFLPLIVLLPGVVALSVGKVIGGYMSGVARRAIVSYVTVSTVVVNVIANVFLTPRFGIVGAAAGSLVSYTFSSLLLTAIASRMTRTPISSFWIPRLSDIRYVATTALALLHR